MSAIGNAIRAQLLADTTVAGLVAARIYPIVLPQNPVMPAVSYQMISEQRTLSLDGAAAPQPYLQIDCWASSFPAVTTLADAVVSVLHGFRGTMGGTVHVSECSQRSREEIYESDAQQYRIVLDFSLWHN